ncbi:MAG TPA: FAD binding domain-containing protein [Planctomycetota bacterium]|nr:FAD binding domain-containing protein [Planctomycetota bacterium]
MLRLPAFEYAAPDSLGGVLAALAERPGRARLLAGGTDLLPNLKHGIEEADVVVSLKRVPDLSEVRELKDGALELGAMITLEALAADATVGRRYPSLARAAGLVAGPHHRRMGTLGGNVCLNTRCVYINQTYFWRSALGYCLKKDGELCHVVKGGKRCVAAASNDTAPVLMTLGARLVIQSAARGRREVGVAEFFVKDGVYNKALQPDELLTHVIVPPPRPGLHGAYAKLRPRDSIDFPRLGVAVAFCIGGAEGAAALAGEAVVSDLRVAVTALAAVPQSLRKVGELAEGGVPGDELWSEIAGEAFAQCHPLTNIDGDPAWRREMVRVFTRRALREALDRGASR